MRPFDQHHHGGFPHPHLGFGRHELPPRASIPPVPPGMPFEFASWGRGWGPPRRGGRGGGRRGRRGDVRTAILALLTDRPMHGYEMIQEITQRSGGIWRPSPGSVYPTLQLLADEGLVVSSEGSGSKRLFELTEEGRAAAKAQDATPPWEQMALDVDPDDVNLRNAIGQLMGAAAQVHHAASGAKKARAIAVINQARREIYAILGEIDEESEED